MPELLLELLSEEIPARMQDLARVELRELLIRSLSNQRLRFDRVDVFATPRRLTAMVGGLPPKQSSASEPRFGPRKGAPEAAIQGFLRSLSKSAHSEPEWRVERGVEKLCVEVHHSGQDTHDVLIQEIPALLARFPWPKSMRWGAYEIRWVRPLQSILCVFDGRLV
ncbi:MAG: glycine--tRNA ligase subunit beta, partial [Geminicoccales bacterium]